MADTKNVDTKRIHKVAPGDLMYPLEIGHTWSILYLFLVALGRDW